MMNYSQSESYAAAGVNVNAGYEAVRQIKSIAESTYIPGVKGTLGGFGGLFAPDLASLKNPVLVSGADGVGTKLKLAILMDRHNTIGIDCVAMCVNDIICSGAKPLFFLDYISCGKNIPETIAEIVSGIAEGCRQAGCALIGGETAEHPGMMEAEDYDVAGFSVGIVDEDQIIDGSRLSEGDSLIGIASSGVHSNGYSLIRKIFHITNSREVLDEYLGDLGETVGEALLRPTRIYAKAVLNLLRDGIDLHAISHITGGGMYENVPRMMREGLTAQIRRDAAPVPPIFPLISQLGNIPEREMYHTFNMGLGMILAVPSGQTASALESLSRSGEQAYLVGNVIPGSQGLDLI